MVLFGPQRILGIDIGTSAIKIVELSEGSEKIRLENYGEFQNRYLYNKPFREFKKQTLLLSTEDIAAVIVSILEEAKIKTKAANFSLPDFSSFFTNFTLPLMSSEELNQAINFEARRYVPLPVSEMALDWVTLKDPGDEKKVKVLLVAIPKRVVAQYQEIASLAKLNLKNLEAETFSLVRSLLDKEKGIFALIDIGAQSTTLSIVEDGALKISHSFNLAANLLTQKLSEELGIDFETAEKLKLKYGLLKEGGVVADVLHLVLDSAIIEIKRIIDFYQKNEGKIVEKVILAGGFAALRGFSEYLSAFLKKPVEIGNPFRQILYPPVLEGFLKELGPSFSIAVGVALGHFK